MFQLNVEWGKGAFGDMGLELMDPLLFEVVGERPVGDNLEQDNAEVVRPNAPYVSGEWGVGCVFADGFCDVLLSARDTVVLCFPYIDKSRSVCANIVERIYYMMCFKRVWNMLNVI